MTKREFELEEIIGPPEHRVIAQTFVDRIMSEIKPIYEDLIINPYIYDELVQEMDQDAGRLQKCRGV